MLCEHLAHHVGLQGEMTTQTTVATADDDESIAKLLIDAHHGFHCLTSDCLGLIARHRTSIGQDIEKRFVVEECLAHILVAPVGNQQTTVNGLYAGRVIVEDD